MRKKPFAAPPDMTDAELELEVRRIYGRIEKVPCVGSAATFEFCLVCAERFRDGDRVVPLPTSSEEAQKPFAKRDTMPVHLQCVMKALRQPMK
jgi:hypothetical protein